MDLKPGEETLLFQVQALGFDFVSNGRSNGAEATVAPAPEQQQTQSNSPRKAPSRSAAAPTTIGFSKASTLGDIASVVRSKNAGPYEITFDVLFDRQEIFQTIKTSDMLTKETIARLFDLSLDQIIWCGFFDQAMAFKATILRIRKDGPVASGGFMENNVHGAQMYVPLMQLELPQTVKDQLLSS